MIPALIAVGIIGLLYGLFFLENRRFAVRHDTIRHKKIKTPFRIVQVSDLHDRTFGKEQCRLLQAIRDAKPDMIVITGDLFNRHRERACKNALLFAEKAVRIAPTYFAEGNHECSLKRTGKRYLEAVSRAGVRVLRNAYADLPQCRLIGLKQFATPKQLDRLTDCDRFNLVLAHRPELFPGYAHTKADAVLSGHAHGGQIRLFKKGIYAPGQGFLPRYTEGLYRIGDTVLYVSRGLGNTIFAPRVFNTPELCVLDFQPGAEEQK